MMIKVVAALRELIVDVAKLLVADGEGGEEPMSREREADIRRQAQDIVDFEILLANITINDTDRSDRHSWNKHVWEWEAQHSYRMLTIHFHHMDKEVQPVKKCVICRRDEEQLYHKMNLTELHLNASFLDWTRYFNSAFQSVGRNIDSGLEVVNYAPVYLRDERLLSWGK